MSKMPIPEWLSALDSLFVRYWELEQLARRRDPDPLVLAGDPLTATQTYRVMEQLNRLLKRYRCGGYLASGGYYVWLTPEGVETLQPSNHTPELETAALNAVLDWLKPPTEILVHATPKESGELRVLRRRLHQAAQKQMRALVPVIGKQGARSAKAKGKRIDERMLATIRDDNEALYWSSNKWHEHLKCAPSTVKESRTWKKVCLPAREEERNRRGRRLRGPRKRAQQQAEE
jgi:hypothetical protein